MSKGFVKFGLYLALALLVSGCNNQTSKKTDIAVVNWEKAVNAHPMHHKLETGEKILKDLLQRREDQENLARTQMTSISKLQMLKKVSEQNYHLADINTKMIALRTYENEKLQKQIKIFEREADAILSERRNSIEKDYKLEIFNLELALQNIRMTPEQKADIEKKISEVKATRDARLAQLAEEKQVIVAQKAAPYVESVKLRLKESQDKFEQDAMLQMANTQEKDAKLLENAPNSLKQALAIMDKEIDKQQEKNNKLRKEISSDIEKSAVNLAKQRGYSVVFNQFKANVKAADITNDIISDLKNTQKNK